VPKITERVHLVEMGTGLEAVGSYAVTSVQGDV